MQLQPKAEVPVLIVHKAVPVTLPIVFDSPHSGRHIPEDAGVVAPRTAINTSWDAYVNELWSATPGLGGVLVEACFSRAYVDVNRARDDIDPSMIEGTWSEPLNPTEKSLLGQGCVRRFALPEVPMYERPLSVGQVRKRLEGYYDVYHATLSSELEACYRRFGAVWHIDCHSMKSVGNAMNTDSGCRRPDFVVSDRHGTTANPEFTEWIADQLRGYGYSVNVNHPYRGAELVRRYGDPGRDRHSIQIEINRALYWDERRFEKTEGFSELRSRLGDFGARLAAYVRHRLAERPGVVSG